MKIDNSQYGAFIVSKNVIAGIPILYSFREESSVNVCNGWTLYSVNDNDEYINDPDNFMLLGAESLAILAPVMLEIFNAPYGTDLYWIYQNDVHIGFYDLEKEKETTIKEILS